MTNLLKNPLTTEAVDKILGEPSGVVEEAVLLGRHFFPHTNDLANLRFTHLTSVIQMIEDFAKDEGFIYSREVLVKHIEDTLEPLYNIAETNTTTESATIAIPRYALSETQLKDLIEAVETAEAELGSTPHGQQDLANLRAELDRR